MISLNTHNVLDYVIGAVLVFCPYLFGFSEVDAARNVFLVLGFGLVAYSLLTDYRYSLVRIIPLGVHMTLDSLAGLSLIAAPWLFGYRDLVTNPQIALHFVMGVGVWLLVGLTRPREGKIGHGKSETTGGDRIDRVA